MEVHLTLWKTQQSFSNINFVPDTSITSKKLLKMSANCMFHLYSKQQFENPSYWPLLLSIPVTASDRVESNETKGEYRQIVSKSLYSRRSVMQVETVDHSVSFNWGGGNKSVPNNRVPMRPLRIFIILRKSEVLNNEQLIRTVVYDCLCKKSIRRCWISFGKS